MQNVSVSAVSSAYVLRVGLCFIFHFGSFESPANDGAEHFFRFKSDFEYLFNISVKMGDECVDIPCIFITDTSSHLYRLP